MAASSIGTCRCGLTLSVGGRETVVIYFPSAWVSFGRCELQFLHFPSAPFFLAIFRSHFLPLMTVFLSFKHFFFIDTVSLKAKLCDKPQLPMQILGKRTSNIAVRYQSYIWTIATWNWKLNILITIATLSSQTKKKFCFHLFNINELFLKKECWPWSSSLCQVLPGIIQGGITHWFRAIQTVLQFL